MGSKAMKRKLAWAVIIFAISLLIGVICAIPGAAIAFGAIVAAGSIGIALLWAASVLDE